MVQSVELFPSEICRVQVGELWWENGEHVARHWFQKELLCLASGVLMKQSSSTCDGFLSSDACKRVVETINNVDIGELGDASLPGAVQALDRTPKS